MASSPLSVAARRARNFLRRPVTGPLRTLPEFVVLGAQKAGTTSLYEYLIQHPDVGDARTKEVHYFDLAYERGPNWYRAHFPTRLHAAWHRAATGRRLVVGEASPYYLFHPLVPERMKRDLPEAKFVVLLRNPVSRAVSQYHHEVRWGFEKRPIAQAFAEEFPMVDDEERRMIADPKYYSFGHHHHSYRARGRYAVQLERWFAHFPQDRFLILRSEDFHADTPRHLDEVCRWLGLAPFGAGIAATDLSERNKGEYEKPDAALLDELRAEFQPHNERLEKLLGRGFGW